MTTSTLQHNDNKADEVENRVIKKLFRRLITFLFVLFVFSFLDRINICLLYTSPSPRDRQKSRMPSSA